MAPNTPLTLAQFALNDAYRTHDALLLANTEVIRALESADEELTRAEYMHEGDPHNGQRMEELWQAHANFEDIRIIYDDVFGGAEQDIREATEALDLIRNTGT